VVPVNRLAKPSQQPKPLKGTQNRPPTRLRKPRGRTTLYQKKKLSRIGEHPNAEPRGGFRGEVGEGKSRFGAEKTLSVIIGKGQKGCGGDLPNAELMGRISGWGHTMCGGKRKSETRRERISLY